MKLFIEVANTHKNVDRLSRHPYEEKSCKYCSKIKSNYMMIEDCVGRISLGQNSYDIWLGEQRKDEAEFNLPASSATSAQEARATPFAG